MAWFYILLAFTVAFAVATFVHGCGMLLSERREARFDCDARTMLLLLAGCLVSSVSLALVTLVTL